MLELSRRPSGQLYDRRAVTRCLRSLIVDAMSRVLLRNVTMSIYRSLMKVRSRAALFVLATLASGCADRGRAVDVREVQPPLEVTTNAATLDVDGGRGVDAPVVIVTLDGVRWQEVFQGTDRV